MEDVFVPIIRWDHRLQRTGKCKKVTLISLSPCNSIFLFLLYRWRGLDSILKRWISSNDEKIVWPRRLPNVPLESAQVIFLLHVLLDDGGIMWHLIKNFLKKISIEPGQSEAPVKKRLKNEALTLFGRSAGWVWTGPFKPRVYRFGTVSPY